MKNLVRVAKLIILFLVVWGLYRSCAQARHDLADQQFSLTQLSGWWLSAAAGLYLLGLLPMGWYWHVLLHRMGQTPGPRESLRAYWIGHLGKYVPGKFMVIVIRTALIRSQRVDTTVAAVSVFVETLTMMASGAFIAAVLLIVWFRDQQLLQLLAIGLSLATALVTFPPILKMVIRQVKSREPPARLDAVLVHVTWRTIALGWCAAGLGWSMMALSLWAILRSMSIEQDLAWSGVLFARLLSSVSLAVVAGFLSLLPGGLGVREWVLDQLMVPQFGVTVSIVAAILLRIIWLLTEVVVSIMLYLCPTDAPRKEA